ncbi:hypothetical protein E3N88_37184 [Mikania micrantha]|uniref:Uncharacterized protein n=1 Tax=Mikania micrantha TaxID=192012 RepID=A0A5N6M5W3_9ASTR|nr:hypothetical protein E3N88_37184 [Mikania micrantha]
MRLSIACNSAAILLDKRFTCDCQLVSNSGLGCGFHILNKGLATIIAKNRAIKMESFMDAHGTWDAIVTPVGVDIASHLLGYHIWSIGFYGRRFNWARQICRCWKQYWFPATLFTGPSYKNGLWHDDVEGTRGAQEWHGASCWSCHKRGVSAAPGDMDLAIRNLQVTRSMLDDHVKKVAVISTVVSLLHTAVLLPLLSVFLHLSSHLLRLHCPIRFQISVIAYSSTIKTSSPRFSPSSSN